MFPARHRAEAIATRTIALTFIDSAARRGMYDYTKPRDWLMDLFVEGKQKISYTVNLSTMTGIDAVSIARLYASNRKQAYRVIDTLYALETAAESQRGSNVAANRKLPVFAQLHQASVTRALEKTEALGAGDLREVFGVDAHAPSRERRI
jgi:hypothetical protein